MKNEREIVEENQETAGCQPCKRKRLTEVLKAPTPVSWMYVVMCRLGPTGCNCSVS